MAIPFANQNTLQGIQQKVRRLTRSPSEAQLSTGDLNNYINTFVVYDFPEHLRTFNLRQPFSFVCNPYQDVYATDILSFGNASNAELNDLYNFQNIYLTVHDPLYIAGYQQFYTQSRQQFFGIYPLTNSIIATGFVGNGVETTYSGVITTPNGAPILINNNLTNSQVSTMIKGNVLFSSVDIYNNGLALIDVPVLDSVTGNPTVWGNLYVPGTEPTVGPLSATPYTPVPSGAPNSLNFINYLTGEFTVTFATPPQTSQQVNAQVIPTVVGLPQAMLYYNNEFTLRPVPDQPYKVEFEVFMRPDALISEGQSPELEEYWQYISYGAAKKIFQDRMDLESVALIEPEFKKQEALCQRRSIVQWTNERTATIYTEQTNMPGSTGWNGWGGQF
jgi:hypothetical protein